jgi:hypothetical protein
MTWSNLYHHDVEGDLESIGPSAVSMLEMNIRINPRVS